MRPGDRSLHAVLMAGASAFCLLMPSAEARAQANAEDGPGWQIYGQLNFGLMSVDNGAGSETYFGENPHIPGRIGARFSTPLAQGGTFGFVAETGFGFTGLDAVSPNDDGFDVDFDRTALRKLEVIYDSGRYGRVSFGQGSMASDGASGMDLTGTSLAQGPAIGDLGGGTEFLLTNGAGSGTTVGASFDDLDGPRRFRLRYDTPDWNGLSLAVAYGQEVLRSGNDLDYSDIALTYATQTDTLRLEAATSYEWIDSVEERALASGSVHHLPTGLTATLAAGGNRIGEGRYVYGKLGMIRNLFATGQTAVSLEYYDGADFAFAEAASRAIGIGVTQRIDPLNLDLVATLRRYDLSSPFASYQSIDVAMIGARLRF